MQSARLQSGHYGNVAYLTSPVHVSAAWSMSDSNTPDALLAERVANRDQCALEALFEQYGGAVKAVALRVLRNEALADDVVQDTFVGFWNAPEKYDAGRGSLRTFLLTIAHRRAVDIVRSEVARARREEKPPDPDHYDVADEVWTRNLAEQVRNALDELAE